MYYRVDTKEVFTTHSEIRNSFMKGDTMVMFSDVITDADLAARGVFPLTSEKPELDAMHVAVPTTVELVDGVWTQQWSVRPMTADEATASKPPVPFSVTRRQARQALLLKGMLDKVAPAIAAIADETVRGMAQIEWEDSQVFERHRPFLIQVGTALGVDADELDDLFRFAATL